MWFGKARFEHLMMRISGLLSRLDSQDKKLMAILAMSVKIEGKLNKVDEREQLAWDRLTVLVSQVAEGMESKDRKIEELTIALGNADQAAVQRVNDALEADSVFDAQKIENANSALSTLVTATQSQTGEMPDPEDLPVTETPSE